jgi:glycosyltransferase involved in cell wall biosynthesis
MIEKKLDISVVTPLLNEEESLPELCNWIEKVMTENGFSYEVILVDDGSTDNSWRIIESIIRENPNIKGIKLNHNYGKSAALNTGFKFSKGDVVITMDADMQDSPDEIPELYKMVMEDDYDLVSGWKKKRHDPSNKTIPSRFFNLVTRKISGIKLHDFNCGLKAYKNTVVKNIDIYGEMHRYIPVIAKWNGFNKIGEKVVDHRPRKFGKTKYGFRRFITGFLDLLSITFMTKFKQKPMHFFGTMGVLSFLFGFIMVIYLVARKLIGLHQNIPVRSIVEQPLFFLSLVAIILGFQLFLTGFLAEMMTMNAARKSKYIIIQKIGIK